MEEAEVEVAEAMAGGEEVWATGWLRERVATKHRCWYLVVGSCLLCSEQVLALIVSCCYVWRSVCKCDEIVGLYFVEGRWQLMLFLLNICLSRGKLFLHMVSLCTCRRASNQFLTGYIILSFRSLLWFYLNVHSTHLVPLYLTRLYHFILAYI